MVLTRVLEIPAILCILFVLLRWRRQRKWPAAPWANAAESVAYGIMLVYGISVVMMGYILLRRY